MQTSVSIIIESIKELRAELKSIIDENELYDRQRLILKTYRGKARPYLVDSDGKCTYLGESQKALIAQYAQKRYNKEVRKTAEREVEQLDRCLKILKADIDAVYDDLPEILKEYVTPNPLSDESYARQWQEGNIVVKKKRIHSKDDYHKYRTIRGDYVGSKSEVIIADRLFSKGIPYHYEVAFIPEAVVDTSMPVFDAYGRLIGYESPYFDPRDRDVLHPDFYVLNKRTRKAYFWEHLGKMDNPKYCTDNLNRLIRAIDSGYSIGQDILITHEDSTHPLKLESIDELIEKYLK